jgi:hypothetical protein
MGRELPKKEDNQKALEMLVDELVKDQPNKAVVKKLSSQLGMPYSGDSMTQINTVLQSMNSLYLRRGQEREIKKAELELES